MLNEDESNVVSSPFKVEIAENSNNSKYHDTY